MSSRDSILAIFLIFIFIIFGFILKFSKYIGADFSVTLNAVIWSCVWVIAVGAAAVAFKLPITPCVFLALFCIWPCWWPVINNIYESLYFVQRPWWAASWTKYLIEAIFFAGIYFSVYRRRYV